MDRCQQPNIQTRQKREEEMIWRITTNAQSVAAASTPERVATAKRKSRR